MAHYASIRRWRDETEKVRTIDRLLAVRKQLAQEIGPHQGDDTLLLATWNIRDFDSNKFGHGHRLKESFHYIAEIIDAFDLVAVQEVNRDMKALARVMRLLGRDWAYIVTDTTEGSGGNEERLAFLYRRTKVSFRNVAGEIVLPAGQKVINIKKVDDEEKTEELQFARSPFVVAFQAGWFKFNLCTVHIYFGSDSGARLKRRIAEIAAIAKFFKRRQERETEDYILLGDFNIVSPEHETMASLEKNGFTIPEDLKKEKSNLKGDKHYDQIALRTREKRLEIGASGVFDIVKSVFRNGDYDAYQGYMVPELRDIHQRGARKGQPRNDAEKRAYYRDEWRTWQMSDHKLMWVALKVDFTEAYLKSLKPGQDPLTG